jgi:CheY-like chemotaxis protein
MTLRFLCVDSEPAIRMGLVRAISRAFPGAEVSEAGSTGDAIESMELYPPDFVSTDLEHPGGGGLTLIKRIKSDPRFRHIPVVAATAQGFRTGMKERLREAGVADVLDKPFRLDEYIEAINRHLRTTANPDVAIIYVGFESPNLDYKETVDLSSKQGRAAIAKDVIAMANYGGGTIVVGVAEQSPGRFDHVGINADQRAALEATNFHNAIGDYLDPIIHVSIRIVRDGPRWFAILKIPSADGGPVMARKSYEKAGLYLGRIYTRSAACESCECATAHDVRQLLVRWCRNIAS